jgi:hypothetical protein
MMVFDQRKSVGWDEKIYMEKETVNGKTVTVVGV